MTATTQATMYDIRGRLLEVCTCEAVCPCWVGLDPDGGTCESILAWAVDSGTVGGVDVGDRVLGLSVHIPGNVLAGNWKAIVYVDDRCDERQEEALLSVFTGKLGGAIADFAALIGDVVAVERVPITFTVEGGNGIVAYGDVARAELTPFRGATGEPTKLADTAFSTIPGSPAYPGIASSFHREAARYGMKDIDITGHNAIQGDFHFSA